MIPTDINKLIININIVYYYTPIILTHNHQHMQTKTLLEIILPLLYMLRLTLGSDATTQSSSSQCSKNNTENNVKSFNDCKSLTLTNNDNFICCFVQPLSGSLENAFCVEMDILFTGKTIEYNFNNKQSKLTCTDKSNNTTSQTNSAILSSFNSIFILCLIILH